MAWGRRQCKRGSLFFLKLFLRGASLDISLSRRCGLQPLSSTFKSCASKHPSFSLSSFQLISYQHGRPNAPLLKPPPPTSLSPNKALPIPLPTQHPPPNPPFRSPIEILQILQTPKTPPKCQTHALPRRETSTSTPPPCNRQRPPFPSSLFFLC